MKLINNKEEYIYVKEILHMLRRTKTLVPSQVTATVSVNEYHRYIIVSRINTLIYLMIILLLRRKKKSISINKFAYLLQMQLLDDLYFFFAVSSIWMDGNMDIYKRLSDIYMKREREKKTRYCRSLIEISPSSLISCFFFFGLNLNKVKVSRNFIYS
jgi:hypothetical protein